MSAPTQADTRTSQLKPLPDLAAYITWQHQQDQEALSNATAYGLAALWPILQFGKLDETTPTWLYAATLQVQQSFGKSERLAFDATQGAAWAWLPESDPLVFTAGDFPVGKVQTGLRVTGPVSVKQQMPAPSEDVMAGAMHSSTGAGTKFAGDGGRAQVVSLVDAVNARQKQQGRVIGYARVTDGNPCYFCALLASRGAVYPAGSFKDSNDKLRKQSDGSLRAFLGDGVDKVHDHCKCTMRAVFSNADDMDARAKNFKKQWDDFTESYRGPYKDQLNAFRKVYVPPSPYESAPPVDLDGVRANHRAAIGGFGAESPQADFFESALQKLA